VDQLSAHLDRGWDLAQKGDTAGASACARRALELDPSSPEVHNLLGYTAALAGESDEALEHYKQAIALDETYFEAMLNAAEVLMYPMGEWDQAIAMCDDALDLAETQEEEADCILLKVDAHLGKGDTEGARRALATMPDGPFENPNYAFLIGRAHYEIGDTEKAVPYIEEAARRDPTHADAHYYLGLVRDEAGDTRGSIEAFLKSRALDLTRPPPAWAPSPETFGAIVQKVLTKVDTLLARYVRQAEVYIVDVPGAELVVEGVDPRAMMILDVPAQDGDDDRPVGRLFVYERNVERVAGSVEALEPELQAALEREIAAVFLDHRDQAPRDKHQLN
jgi:tetratricopeptide (TPR) repeat protein